jgi:uncharacterized Ntn-hydrolase superfamily protein
VTWAGASVGAIATRRSSSATARQAGADERRSGRPTREALLAADAQREVRQVALIDAQGRVAAHTGKMAIAAAGHRIGAQYSVQANLMDNATVWPAMAETFDRTKGDLADRMLAVLAAAQAAGGDIRGRQSAASLSGASSGRRGPAPIMFDPVRIKGPGELRRLLPAARLRSPCGDES